MHAITVLHLVPRGASRQLSGSITVHINPHAPPPHAACGHPHIVHGGAIASLLDDAFGSLFFACRIGNGFTANLNVDYRAPMPAGCDIRIETWVDRVEGRKVFLVGRVVDVNSATVYTEGRALFVMKAVPSSDKLMAAVQGGIHAGGAQTLV